MKYWVTFMKCAGVEIEANSEEEAAELALNVPEEDYEFPQLNSGEWTLDTVNILDDSKK